MSKMRSLQLPKDDLPHDDAVEWWYYHGYVKTKSGKAFSFMTTFFKVKLSQTSVIKEIPSKVLQKLLPLARGRMVHSYLADIEKKKYVTHYHHLPGKLHLRTYEQEGNLALDYAHAHLRRRSGKHFTLLLDTEKLGLDLDFRATNEALQEGPHNQGYLKLRKGQSYYYSYPEMDVKGTVRMGKRAVAVTGKGWMDHQWGNFSVFGTKWTWLGIQLSGGTEYMLFDLAFIKSKGKKRLINARYKDGSQATISTYTLKPTKYWTSKMTGAKYGTTWQLSFKDPQLKKRVTLTIKSRISNMEMNDIESVPYYEGICSVSGKIGSKAIRGKAYLEILNYDMRWVKRYVKDKFGLQM